MMSQISQIDYLIVRDSDQQRGVVAAQEMNDEQLERVTVHWGTGGRLVLPKSALTRQPDGTFSIPFAFTSAASASDTSAPASSGARDTEVVRRERVAPAAESADTEAGEVLAVVPVVAETVSVSKRDVEAGVVRISKTVREEETLVDEPFMREEVDVERHTINRYIDGPMKVRHEGDTMIVPIVEEVLVIEKRLLLKEELHIRKRKVVERHAETITLRREEAHVERLDVDDKSSKS